MSSAQSGANNSGFPRLRTSKNSPAKHIVGIEKNPIGHKYALENLRLNTKIAGKIELLKGDVRKVAPKLKKKFDRILMPLPKSAEDLSVGYYGKQ